MGMESFSRRTLLAVVGFVFFVLFGDVVYASRLLSSSVVEHVAERAHPGEEGGGKGGTTDAGNTPTLIRVAFAGKDNLGQPNGMTVSWTTQSQTETSVVLYGTDSKNLTSRQEGTQQQYLYTSHHHVTVGNLEPSTTYFYTCGDEKGGMSQVLSFQTAPDVRSSGDQGFTVAVIADMGEGNCSANTREQLQNNYAKYDWLWHLGDIAYQDDYLFLDFAYERVLDKYMAEVEFVSAHKPYMVLPGNHEVDCHAIVCILDKTYRESLKNFTAYNARYKMPSVESDGIMNMWYSFNYGQVHFVSMDSETDYENAYENELDEFYLLASGHFSPTANGYLEWLERDLQQAYNERHIRPWIIAAAHRPMYLYKNCSIFREAVEDLLVKYEVDLFLSGHIHKYFRTYPLKNETFVKDYSQRKGKLVNIVTGGAGAINHPMASANGRVGAALNSDQAHEVDENVVDNKEDYVAFQSGEQSFGLLHFINNITMKWELVSSTTGEVLDSLQLTK